MCSLAIRQRPRPTQSAVTVEERVDGLELVVQERGLNERWQLRLIVDEAFEVI